MKPYITFTLCIIFANLLSSQSEQLQITYVGNMGVLIEGKATSVLIDGLHKEYGPAYQYPPKELVQKLTENESFNSPIGLVMNTHIHKDHFDDQLVHEFLKRNKKSVFIGPEQITKELTKLKTSKDQLRGISTEKHGRQKASNPYCSVTAFFLNHANPRMHSKIKNVGYLIEIDDTKIVHFGDAFWIEEVFENLDLEKEKIDIAILPSWMIASTKNRKMINKYIQPKKIIATHISPTYPQTMDNLKEYYPEAISFTEILQEFKYHKEE